MSYSEFTEKDYELIDRDWQVLYASAAKRCADARELETVCQAYAFANEAHKNVRRRRRRWRRRGCRQARR